MREIKFRAWDGEKMHRVFYLSTGPSRRLFCIGEHQQELDGVPVMQYTGLKDKNGQEIYEGDIINTRHYGNLIIEYSEHRGAYEFNCIRGTEKSIFSRDEIVEVIGNIYENPELLTKRPSETKDLS